ncbi:MAG: GspH/FimT family pseudopilin [Candidatus Methylomirabilia bacterium]
MFLIALRRLRLLARHDGYSLTELVTVIALIAIVSATGIPSLLTYLRAEEVRGAATEMAARLHQARQLAITQNSSYRVEVDLAGNRVRFVCISPGCVNPPQNNPWIGPGTDPVLGWMALENQGTITGKTADPVFLPLGNVVPAATITVANSLGTSSLNVVVNSIGRIQIL